MHGELRSQSGATHYPLTASRRDARLAELRDLQSVLYQVAEHREGTPLIKYLDWSELASIVSATINDLQYGLEEVK